MIKTRTIRSATIGTTLFAVLTAIGPARSQDIPGIENCTVEKTMERRTSCLQSNVNYLKAQLTQMQTVSFGRIEAANRQIDALKASVAALQATVAELKAAAEKNNSAAKGDVSKDAQKNDAAKSEPAKK